MIQTSTLTCPACGRRSVHAMPTDACVVRLACPSCYVVLRPLPGDCCVFCSYGDVRCPPMQQDAEPPKMEGRKARTEPQA